MNDFFHAPLKPSVLPVQGASAGLTFLPEVTAECRPEERVSLRPTRCLAAFQTQHLVAATAENSRR